MSIFLILLSGLYGLVMRARNMLFKSGIFKTWHAPMPVISIGNLSAGGTGKTPLVQWVVQLLLENHRSVAMLSRGYGRSLKGVQLVSDGKKVFLNSRQAGDEPLMLARNNMPATMVVAERRREGVEFILSRFAEALPEVIVLDDAFQHRQLARDLDILVVNARSWPTRDSVLPAGRLREPISAISRADLIVLTKVDDLSQVAEFKREFSFYNKPVVACGIHPIGLVSCRTGQGVDTDQASHLNCLVFSGIGEPGQFLKTLNDFKISVVSDKDFGDHYKFTDQDIQKLKEQARVSGADAFVTTEKDVMRLETLENGFAAFNPLPCYYLKIGLRFLEGKELLQQKILEVLAKKQP